MLEIAFSELDSVVRRAADAAPFLRSMDGAALAGLLDGIADALTAAKAQKARKARKALKRHVLWPSAPPRNQLQPTRRRRSRPQERRRWASDDL